jgi:hypothetical protein
MINNITEFKCEFSKEQQEFIDHLLSVDFPLYYITSTEKYKFFSHTFLKRNENLQGSVGIVNSIYWESIHKLFKEICVKYNIEHNIIYRANLNVTLFDKDQMGDLHTDHSFPHKNFLLYLNDFSGGSTYIQDEDTKEIKEIKAEKFKVVIFDGNMHAQGFCSIKERRVVLVITFN